MSIIYNNNRIEVKFNEEIDQLPLNALPVTTTILCESLSFTLEKTLLSAPTAASSGVETQAAPPELRNPQDDPKFNTDIPRTKEGKIDFNALLEKIRMIFNYLKCNLMNLKAGEYAIDLFMKLGSKEIWSQLSASEKDLIKSIMSMPIKLKDGETMLIFKSLYVNNLGDLLACATFLSAFYKSTETTLEGRIKAVRDKIAEFLNKYNMLHDDFKSKWKDGKWEEGKCDLLNQFYERAKRLDEYMPTWASQHWDPTKGALDDKGFPVDFSRWILDAQGYLGKLLYKTTFGDSQHKGSWEKNFYKSRIDAFFKQFDAIKGMKDPYLVLLFFFMILGEQNEDRQMEITGVSQTGKYLSIVNSLNSKALTLFSPRSFPSDIGKIKEFFQYIIDIKRYIEDNADLDDITLKPVFMKNIDVFLKQQVDTGNPGEKKSIEELLKVGDDKSYWQITGFLRKELSPDGSPLYREMTSALSGIADGCKEQSSITGTIVSSMTNVSNQFFALLKNLFDGYIHQQQAAVKNEKTA
jgi:hypothetical protein